MLEGVIWLLILKLRDALTNETVQIGKSFIAYEASALQDLFGEIRKMKEELESMQAFFRTAERFKDADETTVAFVKQIRGLAFNIEDVIDEFTYKLGEDREAMFLLKAIRRVRQIKTWYRLANSLRDIKANLKRAAERRHRYDLKGVERDAKLTRVGSLNRRSAESVHFKREDDLVGIAETRNLLMKWMKDEEQQHMIITVWGMGGVGKTTLAAHVYNAIKTDFDTCAWITVSHSYEADDLLKQIVEEFRKNDRKKEFPKDVDVTDYRSLVETIRRYLENKRYVLVLDDVWSVNVWFDSKDAFSACKLGRIIFTSRIYEVALLASEAQMINLQPLQNHYAWDLFCKEAFWKNENSDCPPELHDWAHKFVEKCNGLPIAIVCIGRLLSFKSATFLEWENVYKTLEMQFTNNFILDMNIILKVSLEDLPHNMKNCFLYCCMFPENHVMQRKWLVRLWVAEGFIEESEHKTLEEVAEDYLTELINRCLLVEVKRNETGYVDDFQMHDILRVLALSKAREENFCIVLDYSRTHLIGQARRLSIQRGDIAHLAESVPHLRSLLVFQNSLSFGSLRSFSRSVKLMSVLNLQDSSIECLPNEVFDLFNLRYLGLRRTKIATISRLIGRLQNLLVFDAWKSKITNLPAEITRLCKLTHLIVTVKPLIPCLQYVPSIGVPAPVGGMCSLASLQTLLLVESSSEMVNYLGALVLLRSFRISKVQGRHCDKLFVAITNMVRLTRLGIQANDDEEVLQLDALNPPPLLQKIFLLGTLAKESLPRFFLSISKLKCLSILRLVWSKLQEDMFCYLEELQQLVKLQLYDAFDGNNMYFRATSFRKLRVLKIWGAPHLSQMTIERGAMPSLVDLKLLLCPELKLLPGGIEHVSTLEELTLNSTAEELVNRVRQKKEENISHVQRVYVGFVRNGELAAERIQ
ncbi:disease resistance protein RPM1-like [Lolium rigidum]|uniref:disease resistance protein RPM1-like n=1 Tax=Lolium rigidum TaxID=89674 RepID=UPI001F5CAAF7|nr:disease resistance protein RPM1-like [Lolium rigidum]XP_051228053.1 disease resistance protein RPM1-like [Lolium perenne]